MTRFLPFLAALLLVGCSNLSHTRDYTPTPGPVNTNDFSPLPVKHSRVLMLSQPASSMVVHAPSSAVAVKPADKVIAFRHPTNAFAFYDVQACSDPSFDYRRGGLTVVLRNCHGAPSGDLVVTNRGQGGLFYRVVGHNDFH